MNAGHAFGPRRSRRGRLLHSASCWCWHQDPAPTWPEQAPAPARRPMSARRQALAVALTVALYLVAAVVQP